MDTKAKVYELVESFDNTMMVTCGPGKRLEARPMHVAKAEENGNIWFFTGNHGRVVQELESEPEVLLCFQEERTKYLSMRGTARVVHDKVKIKELWNETYKVWFPGGIDDPELALLAVDPVDAEYWDNGGLNKLQYMFKTAKAYVTGDRPKVVPTRRTAASRQCRSRSLVLHFVLPFLLV